MECLMCFGWGLAEFPASIASRGNPGGRCSDGRISADVTQQDENQQHKQNDSKRAAGGISPSAAVRIDRQGADEHEEDENEQDRAEHEILRK